MVLSGGLDNSLIFIRSSLFKNILYKKSFYLFKSFRRFTVLNFKAKIVYLQKNYNFQWYNKNFQILLYFFKNIKLFFLRYRKKQYAHFVYKNNLMFLLKSIKSLKKNFITNTFFLLSKMIQPILVFKKNFKLFICFSVLMRRCKFYTFIFFQQIFKYFFNYLLSVVNKTFLFINMRYLKDFYILFLTKIKMKQNIVPMYGTKNDGYQKLLFFYRNFYSNIFNNINFYNLYFFSNIFSEVHFNRVKWYYRFHFDIFFNSYFFTKIINVFMRDGKRAVIFQLFFKIFFFLSLATPLSILSYFLRLFYFLRLSFRLRAFTARGSFALKPVIQRSFVVISQARLMFRKTILKRSEFSFLDKILGESIDLLFYDNSFISIFLENFMVQINSFKKNSLQFRKGNRSFFK